jgi:hypothetical protein
MWKWIARVAVTVTLALAVIATTFLAGMRAKSPLVRDTVRRFNRAVTNPRVLRSAGSPGASASVIQHVGRTTGRSYETPVGPFPTSEGFVIALPYGSETDWARNVLSSGTATLVHEGDTIRVDRPEVIPTTEIVDDLPASEQRTLRVFAVDECMRVRRADALDS